MSSLTKVFVLLVSALAIFLAGVVVSFVAQTSDYRGAYFQQQKKTEAAQIQAKAAEEARRRDADRYSALVERLKADNGDLIARISELSNELNTQMQRVAEAERNARTTAKLSQSLQEANRALYDAQMKLQQDLEVAHREMGAARAQKIAMEQELSSVKAEGMQLKGQQRRNLEQIQDLEDENAQLRQRLLQVKLASNEFQTAGDQVAMVRPEEVTGVPIRGQITDLDGTFASISVGSASGVRQGTVFRVVRGGRFLGELEIDMVEPNAAAGRLVSQLDPIVSGDVVTTGFD